MNKTFRLLAVIVAFAIVLTSSFVASAAPPLQFSNAEVNIDFVDDEFVVSGSFESNVPSSSKYRVYLASYDFDDAFLGLYASEPYSLSAGTNTFTYNAGAIANAQKLKVFVWTDNMKAVCEPIVKIHSNAEIKINYVNNEFVVNGSFESNTAAKTKYKVYLETYDFDDVLVGTYTSEAHSISAGTNTFTYNAGAITGAQKLKAYVVTDKNDILCEPVVKIHSIKILGIGNSFTQDAMSQLYKICKQAEIDKVTLAYLYIGGCSLKTHWTNAEGNLGKYRYYKNTADSWTSSSNRKMGDYIKAEKWDFITLQQASGDSGMPDTYEPYLTNLIEYINSTKTNPKAKILWQATWAYAKNSTHEDYPNYNNDQLTMFNAIISTTRSKVLSHEEIAFVIPTGTAIQNVRTSFLGDSLNRDGYHLNYTTGRYTAALTWFYKITGLPFDTITVAHDTDAIPNNYLTVIKEAVKNAIEKPEEITQSSYSDYNTLYDFSDYTLLDTECTAGYWNCTSSSNFNSIISSTTAIASKLFTKAEIPNGSIIVIDPGYAYRPEGWQTMDAKNANDRPATVTVPVVVEVNDTWWGDYNFRAFNISHSKATTINNVAEVASHLKIYIPKDLATE